MTWVKVCGLTRARDVAVARDAGADAVGFVLAPESPRAVTADQAKRLVGEAGVPAYLVLVDSRPTEALDLADMTGATGVQPHGEFATEVSSAARRAGLRVLRPIPVFDGFTMPTLDPEETPMFDTGGRGVHGGTGVRFDPALIPTMAGTWVLAGGLTAENVAEAIRQTGAPGVDASSGLESAPGVKDHDLVRRYVEEAKST